jgi:hypothetical protein
MAEQPIKCMIRPSNNACATARTVAQHDLPVVLDFRTPSGAVDFSVSFPRGAWTFLLLTGYEVEGQISYEPLP